MAEGNELAAQLGRDGYSRISDGRSVWSYVPRLKQFAWQEAGNRNDVFETDRTLKSYPDPPERLGYYLNLAGNYSSPDNERDPVECLLRLLVPVFSRLYSDALGIESQGFEEVQPGSGRRWAKVQVSSKEYAGEHQILAELTIDPSTLAVSRLVWNNLYLPERTVDVLTINFTRFSVGDDLPEGTFSFSPPKGAERVERVVLPGQTGSALLGGPAPDFLVEDLNGKQLRFSSLRGRPVLLAFWHTFCYECAWLLPLLQQMYEEHGKQGLVVLGVSRAGKQTVRQMVAEAGLTFRVLDDRERYRNLPREIVGPYLERGTVRQTPSVLDYHVSELFRIDTTPWVFLIDRDGKVAGYLKQIIDGDSLRSLLKRAGF